MIGVEPEIVHRGEAYRISVLISRKSLRAPGDKVWICGVNIPRRRAIPGISLSAIMWPTRLLDRRMKSDVTDIDSSPYRHGERLNRAIEVLVIEGVLIVPDASIWPRHFIAHKPDTVRSWSGLNRIAHRRASPSFNGGLLSHGGDHGTKTERLIDSGYAVLTVRSVVIHVAFRGMRLAPDAFIRNDVIRFGKIRRPRI